MAQSIDDFARAFYPFLREEKGEPQDFSAALRFSLLEKVREGVEVKTRFFAENQDAILALALAMAKAFRRGGKLLACGNGGSSCDALHVAVEFMHPITVGRRALPATCLASDLAMVTAVANDVGFADVFARQVIALGNAGDILLGISTSGNSENLLHAFATGQRMGLLTVGLAGGDGGRMAELHAAQAAPEHCLVVPTASIHRVQETHVALYHIIWDLAHEFLQRRSPLED
jgi:D-sedoheptulose 7-phosphate isomerase